MKADSAKVYDTVEFDLTTGTEQKLWPKHCVQDTWGSELHPDLKVGMVVLSFIQAYVFRAPDKLLMLLVFNQIFQRKTLVIKMINIGG